MQIKIRLRSYIFLGSKHAASLRNLRGLRTWALLWYPLLFLGYAGMRNVKNIKKYKLKNANLPKNCGINRQEA